MRILFGKESVFFARNFTSFFRYPNPRFTQSTRKKISSHYYQHTQPPHSHNHTWVNTYYYKGGLAALVLGAIGGAFALGYEVATGKLREKAEHVFQELNPPVVPGNIEISLKTDDCLPIPDKIAKELNHGFWSSHKKSNSLIISGEGGQGKFDLARQVSHHIVERASKKSFTVIELNGHTRENLESGIIAAAKKLGLNQEAITSDSAKSFMQKEIFKKHLTIIIVRCLRVDAISDNYFPIQDIISGFVGGAIKPNAYVIYTTGQQEVLKAATKFDFYHVSLNESYAVRDLLNYIKDLPEQAVLKRKLQQEGSVLTTQLINQLLHNNPTLSRQAIRYLENTDVSLSDYMRLLTLKGKNGVLLSSLYEVCKKDKIAYCIMKEMAALPQHAISIESLIDNLRRNPPLKEAATYPRVARALHELEKYGLVRVDAENNRIYPFMLVDQAKVMLELKHFEGLHTFNNKLNLFKSPFHQIMVQKNLINRQVPKMKL